MGLKQNPRRQLTKLNKISRPGIVLNRYHKQTVLVTVARDIGYESWGVALKKRRGTQLTAP